MKLTTHIRDSICRSIMNDVPQADYREKLQKLYIELQYPKLPLPVQAVWDRKDLREYVRTDDHYSMAEGYIPGIPCGEKTGFVWTKKDREQIAALEAEAAAQGKERKALEAQIRGALNSCTTLAGFIKRYPEFKKYAEQEAGTTANPVAETTLVTSLMKAGWPKKA